MRSSVSHTFKSVTCDRVRKAAFDQLMARLAWELASGFLRGRSRRWSVITTPDLPVTKPSAPIKVVLVVVHKDSSLELRIDPLSGEKCELRRAPSPLCAPCVARCEKSPNYGGIGVGHRLTQCSLYLIPTSPPPLIMSKTGRRVPWAFGRVLRPLGDRL
jgi:hypothetical protein